MVFGETWSNRATSPGVRYLVSSKPFMSLPRCDLIAAAS